MKRAIFLTVFALLGAAAAARADELKWRLNRPGNRPLPPVAESTTFQTVSGTVTVRRDGAVVDAQVVEYEFAPADFLLSFGPLTRVAEGTFFLRVAEIPMNVPHTLTITARYDSRVRGADGRNPRTGRTYVGSVAIPIYNNPAYDFGVRFIDLR